MSPAHRALREGTAAAHARVDALFERFDLGMRSSYAAFLGAHAEVLLPTEAALDAGGASRIAPDWDARRRGGLLIADLADLGVDGIAGGAPAALDDDIASVAGALYVVEGSRLGGRVLARRVGPSLPTRYLDPAQAIANWRTLLAQIDAVLYDESSINRAIVSAEHVFASFEAAGGRRLGKV